MRSTNAGKFIVKGLDRLAEVSLNGRQIKDILKAGQLLVSKQGVELRYSHVDTVMRLQAANTRKAELTEGVAISLS